MFFLSISIILIINYNVPVFGGLTTIEIKTNKILTLFQFIALGAWLRQFSRRHTTYLISSMNRNSASM